MLALSDARVMVLPREPLFEWADQTPGVWPLLGSVLARELGLSRELCHRLMHKDAPARFALWLLQHLALSAPAAGRSVVVLPTRKRDLASELAITPETLSRLMRRFVDEGLIRVVGYTLHVLDRDGLRACAESDS
jgi:CRP-like cAMP-binding protein